MPGKGSRCIRRNNIQYDQIYCLLTDSPELDMLESRSELAVNPFGPLGASGLPAPVLSFISVSAMSTMFIHCQPGDLMLRNQRCRGIPSAVYVNSEAAAIESYDIILPAFI